MSLSVARLFASLIPPELLPLTQGFSLPLGLSTRSRLEGQHSSPARGQSAEFFEHRSYEPGDELRRIDWRATAKGTRTLVRFGQREEPTPLTIILDHHRGMQCGPGTPSEKWTWARGIAALLAYCALREEDPVSIVLDSDDRSIPTRRSLELQGLAQRLALPPTAESSHLPTTVEALNARPSPPARVVCISDWLDLSTPTQAHEPLATQLFASLEQLAHRGSTIWALELLHQQELDFDFGTQDQSLCFVDPNGRRPSQVGDPQVLRESYLNALQEHRSWMAALAQQSAVRWCPMRSDAPWANQLRTQMQPFPGGA